MKVVMLSTDSTILREGSAAYMRAREYKKLFDELHVVLVTGILSLARSYFMCARIVKKDPKSFLVSSQEEFTGFMVMILKWRFGVIWQAQIHTDIFSSHYGRIFFKNKLRKFIVRLTLSHASCARVVSQRIQKSVAGQGFLAPIAILPITPDLTQFSSIQLPNASGECVVLVISRLTREKNIAGAIRAFAGAQKKVPTLKLRIVGDGPERNALEKEAVRLDVSRAVSFLGFQKDIKQELERANIVFLFSWYEGFGVVVAEAMSAGRAVVMSDVGIAGDLLVNDVSGIVVNPGDESAAEAALVRLAQDGALRERLGKEAQKSIAALGGDNYYKKFQEVCESCMK